MTTAVTTRDCVTSHNKLAATVVVMVNNNNNQTFRERWVEKYVYRFWNNIQNDRSVWLLVSQRVGNFAITAVNTMHVCMMYVALHYYNYFIRDLNKLFQIATSITSTPTIFIAYINLMEFKAIYCTEHWRTIFVCAC